MFQWLQSQVDRGLRVAAEIASEAPQIATGVGGEASRIASGVMGETSRISSGFMGEASRIASGITSEVDRVKSVLVMSPTAIRRLADVIMVDRPNLGVHPDEDGTRTVLFTDIQGSTALTERLGTESWMELHREHDALIHQQIALRQECKIVRGTGDGFLLAFRSAREAVRCAIDIQRAFDQRNKTAGARVWVRIGGHSGEFERRKDQPAELYGLHINIASRVCTEAAGGEILVSTVLRDLLKGFSEFIFSRRRAATLEGIKGWQILHVVEWRR